MLVEWPVPTLSASDRADLKVLLDGLTYLGRAESWVDAELLDELPVDTALDLVSPAESCDRAGGFVRLLAPVPAEDFQRWRETEVERREADILMKRRDKRKVGAEAEKARLTKRESAKASAGLPQSLIEALSAETGDTRKAGWNRPPGSRFVDYAVPDGIVDAAPRPFGPASAPELPTVARFQLAGKVLHRLTDAIRVGEAFRRALLRTSDRATVFLGRDHADRPQKGHRHAYYLPESYDRQGRITHVTVYAEAGFDAVARAGFERLGKLVGRQVNEHTVILLGVGQPGDFAGLNGDAGQCRLLASCRMWVSDTPFMATRHPKTRNNGEPKRDAAGLQIGSPEHDLRRLLRLRGYPDPVRIELVSQTLVGEKQTRWIEFRRWRDTGAGRKGGHPGLGFRVEFPEAVAGPIALGYGAHYGLGVFRPER
jgi:CRISPR-associated protein Csb2